MQMSSMGRKLGGIGGRSQRYKQKSAKLQHENKHE